MSLGIMFSVSMTFFFYVKYQLVYDRFNAKSDRIYKLVTKLSTPNEKVSSTISSWAVAPNIDSNLGLVQQTARILYSNFRLKSRDSHFITTNGLFADGSVFKIFDFPLISGFAETALKEPFSVVLTEKTAAQIFGNQNPLGQILYFHDSNQSFTVTAIAQNLPENSQIKTDLFVSMPTLIKALDTKTEPENIGVITYILLKAKSSKFRAQAGINKLFSGADSETLKKIITKKQFVLQPLRDNYFSSSLSQFHVFSIYASSVILLILLLVTINSLVKIILLQLSLSGGPMENRNRQLVSKVCSVVLVAYILSHLISLSIICVFFDITFTEILYMYFTIAAAILIFSIVSSVVLSLWVTVRVSAEPIRTYLMIKKGS